MSNRAVDATWVGSATPIDHEHLGRYTMGNLPLEIEVLQLFAGQAPSTLADLAASSTAKDWLMAAHTLKGSARAVGAWAVASAAEDAERAGADCPHRAELLERLEALVNEAGRYIGELAVAA